jgi:hypothetical protein
MSRAARASLVAIAPASAAAALAAMSGCTLLSGWSDLQTGTKDAGGTRPATVDSGPPTDGATDDAGNGTDPDSGTGTRIDSGGAPATGITCGAGQCAPGEGCCGGFSGGKKCAKASACDVNGGDYFLACTSSASCDSHAPVCCFDFTSEQAACAGSCSQGNPAVCDGPPNTCPNGQACTDRLPGTQDVRTCK